MTHRPLTRVARGVLLTGVLVATGCGSGAPQPPPMPAIDDVRDVRGVDPCSLLSADRAAELDLPADGEASAAVEGPSCTWRGDGDTALQITLYLGGGGLATLAANSEPTTSRVRVAGYPALETFTEGGGFCQYDVGIAPDQVVLAGLTDGTGDTGDTADSCAALQPVLTAMVDGLPSAR